MDTVPSNATLPAITASEVIPMIPAGDNYPFVYRGSIRGDVTLPDNSHPGANKGAGALGCWRAELVQVVRISPIS